MKNLLFIPWMVAFLGACHHTKNLSGQNYNTVPVDLLARNFNLPKFEIKRIDSLEHTYIFFAKSDSGRWYQVVTVRNESQICRNISVGTRCGIMFRSIFRGSLDRKLDGGYLHISSVNYNGDAVPIDASCGYDVFAADNIEGLCLKFE